MSRSGTKADVIDEFPQPSSVATTSGPQHSTTPARSITCDGRDGHRRPSPRNMHRHGGNETVNTPVSASMVPIGVLAHPVRGLPLPF
jgi:hypothetical protein